MSHHITTCSGTGIQSRLIATSPSLFDPSRLTVGWPFWPWSWRRHQRMPSALSPQPSSAVLSRPQPSSAAFRNSAFSSSGRSVVFHRKCCGPSASCSQKTRGSWMAYEPKWIKCVDGSGNIKTIQWQIWLNLKESRPCFLWLMFTSKTSSSVLPDWHKRKTPCSVELRKRGRRHWLQIEGWVHLKPWQEGSVVCTSSHSNGWSIQ